MDDNKTYPYLRVRTAYYKKIKKPLLSGDFVETLTPWSLDVIKQDYGRKWTEIFDQIPKYDGFTNIPSHINYKRSYKGFYNQYEPLTIKPSEGDFNAIQAFLKHIFGEQLHLGLDYLTILYQKPTGYFGATMPVISVKPCHYKRSYNYIKKLLLFLFQYSFSERLALKVYTV